LGDQPHDFQSARLSAAAAGSLGALAWGSAAAATADTLEDVTQRGTLNCGVSEGLQGFSERAIRQGQLERLRRRFLPRRRRGDLRRRRQGDLSSRSRRPSVSRRCKASRIDVLSRNSTWTLEREATLGLLFAGITYHDGQGFMVVGKKDVTSALELAGAKVCVQAGTTSASIVADYFARQLA
jgi:general L-amino acid transport system substrate-binding protein